MTNQDYDKVKQHHREICEFYQKLDHNGAYMDDIDTRVDQLPEIKYEIEVLDDITFEWYKDEYLTEKEYKWLLGKIGECEKLLNFKIVRK